MKIRLIMWASISVNVALVSFFIYRRATSKPSGIDYNIWNQSRNDVLAGLPVDTGSIVFIGTSLTEGFPLNELYPGLPVKNRGISGNKISHILSRIAPILHASPKKLFIEAGTNDLVNDENVLISDYREVLTIVKKSGVRAYIQSLPPLCRSSLKYQAKADRVNLFLHSLCDSLRLPFIDISNPLKKGEGMDTALSYDGIHMNAKGYSIWKKAIDPYIRN